MIGPSKILTVSYGTFSCTLEGFDDPFNTMRAIAEYFRDLAAEDRYFGAEPPTPDAAMLHRIAEREINRRVEANIQENGVILRAADAVSAHAPPAQTAPSIAVPAAVTPPTPTMVPQVAPPLAEIAEGDDDSVAARLQRLREAQVIAAGEIHPETGADSDDAEEPTAPFGDPLDADTLASVMADLAEPLPEDTASEDAPEPPVVAVEPSEVPPTLPLVEAVTAADFDEVEPQEVDSVADLATDWQDGSPAPVASSDAQPADQPEAAADHPAEPDATATDDAILRATLGAMIDPEGDDDFDAGADATSAATPIDATPVTDAKPARASNEGEDTRSVAGVTDGTETVEAEVADAIVSEALAPTAASDDTMAQESVPHESTSDETAADAQAESRNAERLQRARARVIKIRRIDVAAAAPAPAPEPEPEAPVEETASTELSPEAEAELMRELADLEADLAPASDAKPAPEAHPAPEPQVAAGPAPADDAVNRLISQTNAAMEGPENKRRLAAIAHLKAAVAATFADRRANVAPAQPGPAERMDPYRDDLDRVVRPRRPALIAPSGEAAPQPSARPHMDTRPAPLVLVSEQRIDRPAAAPTKPLVTPVRPRRVTTDVIAHDARTGDRDRETDDQDGLTEEDVNNIFADPSQPFAEFADRLGAVTMPDLMEAAAAYCALQLGRDQFTRPLLLQQIAGLPTSDDFNREDCLRGFGTLLRDGRIEKIKRGQFKLSGQSRYLIEGKRLAG